MACRHLTYFGKFIRCDDALLEPVTTLWVGTLWFFLLYNVVAYPKSEGQKNKL